MIDRRAVWSIGGRWVGLDDGSYLSMLGVLPSLWAHSSHPRGDRPVAGVGLDSQALVFVGEIHRLSSWSSRPPSLVVSPLRLLSCRPCVSLLIVLFPLLCLFPLPPPRHFLPSSSSCRPSSLLSRVRGLVSSWWRGQRYQLGGQEDR